MDVALKSRVHGTACVSKKHRPGSCAAPRAIAHNHGNQHARDVGIKEVHDDIRLVSFMDYDLGYFDLEPRVLEPLENPFGPKVLPMS
jgi:hypothetical protein